LTIAVLLTAAVVLGVVGLWKSDLGRRPRPDLTTLAGSRLPEESPLAGSLSCRDCHPGETAGHEASGHARTLQPAAATEAAHAIDGRRFDDPALPGQSWSYRIEGSRLVAERRENGEFRSRQLLDLALGSGAHATTFVSLSPDPAGGPLSGLEHRLTYYRHEGSMGVTPGQAAAQDQPGRSPDGFALSPARLLDCLSCHGTHAAPASGSLRPETFLPNVHCERCHGPAREHVRRAEAGIRSERLLALPFGPGRATAADQIELCGRCHRLPSMVPAESIVPENAALARFPSVGLVQSACYTRSAGQLRCTTCHDPHARAASAANRYEAACLDCHASGPVDPATEPIPMRQVPCPVNPDSGCVGCHMPAREVGYGLRFTDHWIRRRADG
jgi:hypothetical protein